MDFFCINSNTCSPKKTPKSLSNLINSGTESESAFINRCLMDFGKAIQSCALKSIDTDSTAPVASSNLYIKEQTAISTPSSEDPDINPRPVIVCSLIILTNLPLRFQYIQQPPLFLSHLKSI